MKEFKRRWWAWVHNCLAHPAEGWCVLLLGRAPRWVDRFHEWSADKAYADF
jgi:hypothetical protein